MVAISDAAAVHEKRDMRRSIIERRNQINSVEQLARSGVICTKVHNFLNEKIDVSHQLIAVYFAMNSEVDPLPLVEQLMGEGARICYPLMVKCAAVGTAASASDASGAAAGGSAAGGIPPRAKEMRFFEVPAQRFAEHKSTVLNRQLHAFEIDELLAAGLHEVAPAEIAAVVVPLVAFDDQGYRLGYGGGNYDQFLPQLRPGAAVVGVAFEEQRVCAVPHESHDLQLPEIITG